MPFFEFRIFHYHSKSTFYFTGEHLGFDSNQIRQNLSRRPVRDMHQKPSNLPLRRRCTFQNLRPLQKRDPWPRLLRFILRQHFLFGFHLWNNLRLLYQRSHRFTTEKFGNGFFRDSQGRNLAFDQHGHENMGRPKCDFGR